MKEMKQWIDGLPVHPDAAIFVRQVSAGGSRSERGRDGGVI